MCYLDINQGPIATAGDIDAEVALDLEIKLNSLGNSNWNLIIFCLSHQSLISSDIFQTQSHVGVPGIKRHGQVPSQ